MARPLSTTNQRKHGQKRAEVKQRKLEKNKQIERTKKINMVSPDLLKRLQAVRSIYVDYQYTTCVYM